MDTETLEAALKALEQYKEGSGRGALVPLDDAVAASLAHPGDRAKLEDRLASLLGKPLSTPAKEYICRKLAIAGTARSVPAVAALLDQSELLSEAGRTALQAMPFAEAQTALRESLAKLTGVRKVAVVNSLGASRDVKSVAVLKELLGNSDQETAAAAAAALGEIGTKEAAKALALAQSNAAQTFRTKLADAQLACAERLLEGGEKVAALAIYKPLSESQQPPQVQLAAKRGLLRVLQQKDS